MKPAAILNAVRKLESSTNVAAYIILNASGGHVATARIKYPPNGHGERRLTAYLADWTLERPEGLEWSDFSRWQIGHASGYGYDKATAAFGGMKLQNLTLADQGQDWTRQLRDAGYTVIQAI
jgi:hypothetical protein